MGNFIYITLNALHISTIILQGGYERKKRMGGDRSVESKEWYMAAYATEGVPSSDHLKMRSVTLSVGVDHIPDGHVAVEIIWISVDPYLRTKMCGRKDGLDMPPFQLNQVLHLVSDVSHTNDFVFVLF